VIAIDFFSSNFGDGIYASSSLPSPRIRIAPAENTATLSWLVPSTGFALQQSADLLSWSTLTNTPVLNLSNLLEQVSLPLSGTGDFFRLKTP